MALVVLTRLAVTYDLMPVEALGKIVGLVHDKGALVYIDDAGGAWVGPAAFEQLQMLELGVDIGATDWTNTARKGRVWDCSLGERISSPKFQQRASNSA